MKARSRELISAADSVLTLFRSTTIGEECSQGEGVERHSIFAPAYRSFQFIEFLRCAHVCTLLFICISKAERCLWRVYELSTLSKKYRNNVDFWRKKKKSCAGTSSGSYLMIIYSFFSLNFCRYEKKIIFFALLRIVFFSTE